MKIPTQTPPILRTLCRDGAMPGTNDYTVGWICALTCEYVAAQSCLDEEHDDVSVASTTDSNEYTLGRIGKHNVVMAALPEGEYGTTSATSAATNMLRSFPNIRIGLMVGISGGVPTRHDIRLGDVVVSTPRDGMSGVFQYDFGKTIQDQTFVHTGVLDKPPSPLLSAVRRVEAHYERKGHRIEEAVNTILTANPRLRPKYSRPNSASDLLFKSDLTHDNICGREGCVDNHLNLVPRRERTQFEDIPTIHYGTIASGNQLIKDAIIRDKLAREKDILCFEMEAAGLMNHFPCMVIRGICDYSDSHKNDQWQRYASLTAALYAKDLLCHVSPRKIDKQERIADLLFQG
ncbi:hypothetical protein BDW72DRAFT_209019 [Aspergillus terricola var. indicus]